MTFPVDLLSPRPGRLYGNVFENSHVGLERGLFWSVHVPFEDVEYQEIRLSCSAAVEWMRFPGADAWSGLANRSLQLPEDPDFAEASWYWHVHEPAERGSVRFGARRGLEFDVSIELVVPFTGWTGDDSARALTVRAESRVTFEGIYIVPKSLGLEHSDRPGMLRAAEAFIDLDGLELVELDARRYRLEPLA